MSKFQIVSDFKPAGDQVQAIKELTRGINQQKPIQVLLGVTGSGKTFSMAHVIANAGKPTLIISPNKILAAQLYAEFKSFFPKNAVEYFISYYDYYQPEAYVPQSDTYIEKDSSVNAHIDRLRLKATSSLMEREDCIVVASVSCIYNLGSPLDYRNMCVHVELGKMRSRRTLLDELISVHYERNEIEFVQGKFRVRGESIEVFPAYLEVAYRIEFFGDEIEKIREINPLTGDVTAERERLFIYPAKHFVTTPPSLERALKEIRLEMEAQVSFFKDQGKLLEAQRIEQRTKYDLEMLKNVGFCHGIENYSRPLSGRLPGERPDCLMDYFPKDFLVIVDESHVTLPQIRGMFEGDRARKQTLVNYGFRLPSALDNRLLRFAEFENLAKQLVCVSATPGPYELERVRGEIVEQVIRPTGLVDPEVYIHPIQGQIQDLMRRAKDKVSRKQRVLVTTLTKRSAEDLTAYLSEMNFKVRYMHSDIDALERIKIIQGLRKGEFDILVGINLLREGLDLPEVCLVAILDADKEGFLRSETTLIQTCGRAARNINGEVVLYADQITGSMSRALSEMNRRRSKQLEHNKRYNIKPQTIIKAVRDLEEFQIHAKEKSLDSVYPEFSKTKMDPQGLQDLLADMEKQMRAAADILDFELAALIRDRIQQIKEMKAS